MKLKLLAAAAAMTMFGAAANAATITPVYADCDAGVTNWNGAGVMCGGAGRSDASAVNLGAADGAFYSLGLGTAGVPGVAVFEIDPMFTGPAAVVEVTYTPSSHWEAADVFVALKDAGGNYDAASAMYIGYVTNGKGGTEAAITTLSFSGYWNYLYFQDASEFYYPGTSSKDGFDLDSVSVTTVPLPAGALLLGGALAGLGAMRRRKAQA